MWHPIHSSLQLQIKIELKCKYNIGEQTQKWNDHLRDWNYLKIGKRHQAKEIPEDHQDKRLKLQDWNSKPQSKPINAWIPKMGKPYINRNPKMANP